MQMRPRSNFPPRLATANVSTSRGFPPSQQPGFKNRLLAVIDFAQQRTPPPVRLYPACCQVVNMEWPRWPHLDARTRLLFRFDHRPPIFSGDPQQDGGAPPCWWAAAGAGPAASGHRRCVGGGGSTLVSSPNHAETLEISTKPTTRMQHRHEQCIYTLKNFPRA